MSGHFFESDKAQRLRAAAAGAIQRDTDDTKGLPTLCPGCFRRNPTYLVHIRTNSTFAFGTYQCMWCNHIGTFRQDNIVMAKEGVE